MPQQRSVTLSDRLVKKTFATVSNQTELNLENKLPHRRYDCQPKSYNLIIVEGIPVGTLEEKLRANSMNLRISLLCLELAKGLEPPTL
jgi:hypothetical protein